MGEEFDQAVGGREEAGSTVMTFVNLKALYKLSQCPSSGPYSDINPVV